MSAIVDFHNAYVEYLKASPSGDPALRSQAVELIPAAQEAMDVAGVAPVMYPAANRLGSYCAAS